MSDIGRRPQPGIVEAWDEAGLDALQQNFEALFGDNLQGFRLDEFEAELAELASSRSYLVTEDDGTLSVQVIPIPVTDGGTGLTVFAVGDILYASTTTALSRLAVGAAGKVLRSNGTLPVYSTFTVADTFAQGDIIYASATDTLVALAKDTNATRYLSNTGASNSPAWAQVNLANGVTGDLPFSNLVQASGASLLAGRGSAAGAGDFQEISLGTGLSMSGTTLSATGTVTITGTPADNQVAIWTSATAIEGTSALTFDGATLTTTVALSVDGDILRSGDGLFRQTTSDGSDTGRLTFAGGGAADVSRGAIMFFWGNEGAGTGRIVFSPGNVAGSDFTINDRTSTFQALNIDGGTGNATFGAGTHIFVPASGAAGDPEYSFTGDGNTGMYQDGADVVSFAAGGSQIASITVAGLGIGTVTFGTSAARVLSISNGTVPSTSPADHIQIFSVDISAGNASLGLRTEATVQSAATSSDRYLNIKVNGTTYKLLLAT